MKNSKPLATDYFCPYLFFRRLIAAADNHRVVSKRGLNVLTVGCKVYYFDMFALIYSAFLNGNEMSSPAYYLSTFIIAFSFFSIGVKVMNKMKLKK